MAAAVACVRKMSNNLRLAALTPCLSNLCFCGKLSSNIGIRNISSSRTSSTILLRRQTSARKFQVAKYFVKEKPKDPHAPSSIAWAAIGGITCGLFISLFAYLGSPTEEDDLYKDENFVLGYIYRTRDWLHDYREQFTQPSSDVLLPDPLPEPYIQPKYTLVLEMTDVLVHPEYDRTSGWRFRKRPGVAAFLKALTLPMFEIVIYTHENGFSSAPVVDGLDPEGFIMYRLYRDATKYMNGTHVKDLSKLNRDITKVILVDCDSKTSSLQPRNALVLKKWEGDPKDTDLFELIPFFHMIATSNVDDVRPILDFYRTEEDVVAAFRRNQELLMKQQEELLQAQQQKPQSGGFLSKGFFGRRT